MSDPSADSQGQMSEEAFLKAWRACRTRARMLLSLAGISIIYTILYGMSVYNRMPARVPIHFDLYGQPDGWGGASIWTVFGSVIVAAVLVGGMALLALTRPRVHLFNFPGKERALRLPPLSQAYALAPIQEAMAWLGFGVSVGLCVMSLGGWQIAMGQRATIAPVEFLVPLGFGLAAVAIGIMATRARIAVAEQTKL